MMKTVMVVTGRVAEVLGAVDTEETVEMEVMILISHRAAQQVRLETITGQNVGIPLRRRRGLSSSSSARHCPSLC
eukprot:6490958-Amphidinium_carterae.2